MPSGRRGRFAVGTTVLDAARSLGVYVESVCGGRGLCGRCQVQLAEGHFAKHGILSLAGNLSPFSATEQRYLERRSLPAGRRLGCAATIQGDIVIDVPADVAVNAQVVRKRAETRAIARDPATHLHYVELPPPDLHAPLGDLDRLLAAIERDFAIADIDCDVAVLPQVQAALVAGGYKATVAVHQDAGRKRLTAIWPGYRERLFGVAVDIGSTTIACHLVDLMSGRTLASAGTANPQIRFGEDLMSRVSYAMLNPDGRRALTDAVRAAIATLIGRVAGQGGIAAEEIVEAVLVGNPIMHHLYLGIDPAPLGQAPFPLAVSRALDLPARELGLPIQPAGRVYLLPCIAGHVGADAAAATLAEAPHKGAEITLLVDVGTNAEIVLGSADRLLAASSPTGPAFEGAEISSGQRAAPGAIERVRIDPATLEPRIRVIGVDQWSDEEGFAEAAGAVGVTGICGSGIIEAIAELFLAGVITSDGVIDPAMAARSPRVEADGRTFSYLLWEGAQRIVVKQTDVRAIQLAKAALYAGARLLMDKLGVATVDRVKLAGAFGSHIDPRHAMILGLVPDCPLDKVAAVGNAAGTGARMALLNRGARREVETLVRSIEKIETAVEPRFQEHFVNAMAFPNKVEEFPNLAAAVSLPERAPAASEGRRRRGRERG
ncbi:MAG: ASKHA domain-containing protein [Thalassobaculales bacterium]